MHKFNLGELVEVSDTGSVYTSYTDKFIEFGFHDTETNNPDLKEGDLVQITHEGTHNTFKCDIYGCMTADGEEFIIDKAGLKETDKFKLQRKLSFIVAGHNSKISAKSLKVGCTKIDKQSFIDVIEFALSVKFINFEDIKP